MSDAVRHDLPGLYRETRERLTALVRSLDTRALATPVPACPGWAVRDVVAHLAAVSEDAVAGRITGLPTEEFTAAQVARLADVPVHEVLDLWAAAAPQFEEIIGAAKVRPAVVDLATHEQDIRGAVGIPGARDSAAVLQCAAMLLADLPVPVPLLVVTSDGEFAAGPGRTGVDESASPDSPDADYEAPGSSGCTPRAAGLVLSTTLFEAFRWRMGRRSRAQLAAMDWTGDPSPVLDHLSIFGPAASDVIE
jgi:uncharacterized protein (TIGR03083 family)